VRHPAGTPQPAGHRRARKYPRRPTAPAPPPKDRPRPARAKDTRGQDTDDSGATRSPPWKTNAPPLTVPAAGAVPAVPRTGTAGTTSTVRIPRHRLTRPPAAAQTGPQCGHSARNCLGGTVRGPDFEKLGPSRAGWLAGLRSKFPDQTPSASAFGQETLHSNPPATQKQKTKSKNKSEKQKAKDTQWYR
jgi:hypothetical protein